MCRGAEQLEGLAKVVVNKFGVITSIDTCD